MVSNPQNWQGFSSSEFGETSKRAMQRFPKKREFKNFRRDTINHLQGGNGWKRNQSSSAFRHSVKQLVFHICYETLPGSPVHILNAKNPNEGSDPNDKPGKVSVKPVAANGHSVHLDSMPDSNRVPFNPKKQRLVWRKKSGLENATQEF
jgi:hypothetical protein